MGQLRQGIPAPAGLLAQGADEGDEQHDTLLVIVWHGLYNLVSGTQAATGVVAAVVSTLVMIQGVVLIILELRARRVRTVFGARPA